jgi:hypothetical protein
MKQEMNKSLAPMKTKRIPGGGCGKIIAGLAGLLALNAQAVVQVTRFDPPLNINAYADVERRILTVFQLPAMSEPFRSIQPSAAVSFHPSARTFTRGRLVTQTAMI